MAIQRKHPLIERFIRFFYWPKTMLVGNAFNYEIHNDLLKEDDYEFEKVPASSSIILKIVAVLLYPFFNPLAALLSFIRAKANPKMVEAIKEQKVDGAALKKKIKTHFEQNKASLTAQEALKQFDEKEEDLKGKWNDFKKLIDTPSAWDKNADEFNDLLKKASDNFSLLLVAMSKIIEEEQKTTTYKTIKNRLGIPVPLASPEGIAERIAVQPQMMQEPFKGQPAFAFRFNYNLLLEMYHYCRSGVYFIKDEEAEDEEDKLLLRRPTKADGSSIETVIDKKRHANAPDFYVSGYYDYDFRQTYNTNVKLFYGLFGGEKFRKALQKADERLTKWSPIDTSKNETSFKPMG